MTSSSTNTCTYCAFWDWDGTCAFEQTAGPMTSFRECTRDTPDQKQNIEFRNDGETVVVSSNDGSGRVEAETARVCVAQVSGVPVIYPAVEGTQRQMCRNLALNPQNGLHGGSNYWGIGCVHSESTRGLSFSGWSHTSTASAPDPSPNCGW